MTGKTPHQTAVGVEYVDEAIARTRYVVVFLWVLFGVGNKEIAVDVLDAEWCKTSWNFRIDETAAGGYRDVLAIAVGIGRAEYIDCPGVEVGREKKDTVLIGADHKAFIDRTTGGIVEGYDGLTGVRDCSRRAIRTARSSCDLRWRLGMREPLAVSVRASGSHPRKCANVTALHGRRSANAGDRRRSSRKLDFSARHRRVISCESRLSRRVVD